MRWIIFRAPRRRSDARIHAASVPSTRSLITPNGKQIKINHILLDLFKYEVFVQCIHILVFIQPSPPRDSLTFEFDG